MSDFVIPKKTYETVEEGIYLAEITSCEQADGQFGAQVKIGFRLLDAEKETDLTGWCSANYTEKTKLFKWSRAALGSAFNPDADFKASALIGKRVMLNVSVRISANGNEFNKIEDVSPIRAPARRKTVADINNELGYSEEGEQPPPQQAIWNDNE